MGFSYKFLLGALPFLFLIILETGSVFSREVTPKGVTPTVTLKWSPVPKTTHYQVEIFSQEKKFLRKIKSKFSFLELVPPSHHFFWKVQAYQGDIAIDSSALAKFEVRFSRPELEMIRGQGRVVFEPKKFISLPWMQFRYLVAPDEDFKNAREMLSKNPKLLLKPKAGQDYHVKLQFVDAEGKELSSYSLPQSLVSLKKGGGPIRLLPEDPYKIYFSIFYALSRGSIQELTPIDGIRLSSTQNSALTLGVSLFQKLPQHPWNYSASLYVAKLNGAASSTSSIPLTIPWEFGLNGYLGYKKRTWPVEVYGGADLERFSSFNTDELLPARVPLTTREHMLGFLTLGVSKKFEIYSLNVLVKSSFSYSVFSSQSRPSLFTEEPFTGTKMIFFVNVRPNRWWSYHAFYKQHNLTGATELDISRIGFGFSYHF